MPIVEYTPDLYPEVEKLASRIGPLCPLGHRGFVDHYYLGHETCRLYVSLDRRGEAVGALGVDRVRFEHRGEPLDVAFPSNYYTLARGAGGYLYRRWLKSCTYGALLGGSADTLHIFRAQGWTFFPGVQLLHINRPFPAGPGAPAWERVARLVARRLARTSLARCARRIAHARDRISVVEERRYTPDLVPAGPAFALRFAPPVEYLAWRYALDLGFVRYRLFRVVSDGESAGYVIVEQRPRRLAVAHCDGRDPSTLAFGVLASILACAGPGPGDRREIVVASSHPAMIRVYTAFGLRLARRPPPLAMGALRGPVALDTDTSRWLVNYDWGDNCLRRPFLDEAG